MQKNHLRQTQDKHMNTIIDKMEIVISTSINDISKRPLTGLNYNSCEKDIVQILHHSPLSKY